MFHARFLNLVSLLSAVGFVAAQAPAWGQCGGQGWSGATTCVSGYTCTYSNPFYSQCVPGTASSTQPATTSTSAPQPTGTSTGGPKFWFSFGDSYTSTGFNANGAKPSNSNPIGNPNFPGNPTTPGANWVGWVTSTYNNSLLYTYNYAVGGATIDANLVKPYSGSTIVTQVQTFLDTVSSKPSSTPWTNANALFSVFIGINDIGATFNQGGDRGAFSDTLLNAYFAQVQKLYNAGARNFLFVNVPPVDRSPQVMGQGAGNAATEKGVIITFNSKLLSRVNSFKAANSGVTTFYWDSWTTFTNILNSPSTYGFRDATSVGNSAGLFWGDAYHPSSAAHKVFGEEVGRKVLSGTVW